MKNIAFLNDLVNTKPFSKLHPELIEHAIIGLNETVKKVQIENWDFIHENHPEYREMLREKIAEIAFNSESKKNNQEVIVENNGRNKRNYLETISMILLCQEEVIETMTKQLERLKSENSMMLKMISYSRNSEKIESAIA